MINLRTVLFKNHIFLCCFRTKCLFFIYNFPLFVKLQEVGKYMI